MTRRPVVVVGDALLDRDLDGTAERLCPDAPVPVVDDVVERARPGGAALAAALAAADGGPVVLISALATDRAGLELAGLLAGAGVEVVDLGLQGPTPEKVRVRADGRSLVRIDRGTSAGRPGAWTAAGSEALAGAGAVLVSDYGRGVTALAGLREALSELPHGVPTVWDPHPRGAPPVPGMRLVTPNAAEAASFAPEVAGGGLAAHTGRARALAARWQAAAVAVTLGGQGALLAVGDLPPLVVPAPSAVGDVCGAGDRFASAAAGLLAAGALPSEAVAGAVQAASRFVASGGAAGAFAVDRGPAVDGGVGRRGVSSTPPPPGPNSALEGAEHGVERVAERVAERVRAAGGTVVATGGCFDLLHAGHVHMLQAARALGDCLVVCLNSDASVRRLKGPGRPLMTSDDRAAVLLGLDCVDAVAVFDEDTPVPVLDRLRPHIFAKGADYAVSDLPEAELLTRWGGQAVVVPFLQGRSTSRIVEEVAQHAAG